MRLVTVVGTRPQLIKAAALQPALRARHTEVLVDTGQHWSEELAGRFFAELGLQQPDHSLGIGGGTHATQTAAMLAALEPVLVAEHPDAVVIYGDTNSTLAGAITAAKLEIPVAHVEAGLRSLDRRMPEEVNRIVADHLSTWLFAPTPSAVGNLASEGLVSGVRLVGDLMQDLAAGTLPSIRDPSILESIRRELVGSQGLHLAPGRYIFATVHRQANRDLESMVRWSALLASVSRPERPVVVAVHPGTRAAMSRAGVELPASVVAVQPVGYRSSLALQLHAAAVVTDSGGMQREAAWLGVPCLVLRDTTEWHEAVERSSGQMVMVSTDRHKAVEALNRIAPIGRTADAAMERARSVVLEGPGAAAAIAEALDR